VSGDGSTRVFFPAGGKVTLNDLTVTRGITAGGNAGGIRNSDGTLTLNNCTVSDSAASTEGGGGIINDQRQVNLDWMRRSGR
jgi:hypothetical protein